MKKRLNTVRMNNSSWTLLENWMVFVELMQTHFGIHHPAGDSCMGENLLLQGDLEHCESGGYQ